jgi:thiol:disulfide interchange protein
MKTCFALMLARAIGTAAQDSKAPRGGKIEWRRDVDAALAEAKKSGRPAMLYFTADW